MSSVISPGRRTTLNAQPVISQDQRRWVPWGAPRPISRAEFGRGCPPARGQPEDRPPSRRRWNSGRHLLERWRRALLSRLGTTPRLAIVPQKDRGAGQLTGQRDGVQDRREMLAEIFERISGEVPPEEWPEQRAQPH